MEVSKFYTGIHDCGWLLETALKPIRETLPAFKSFLLWGNEDCPTRIALYADAIPHFSASPLVTLVLTEDGQYREE
jgi:hypothetical protein